MLRSATRLATPTIGALAVSAALATSASAATPIEAEELARAPSSAGVLFADSTASAKRALLLWSNSTITQSTKSSIKTITLRAYGDQCQGAPKLKLTVDKKVYPTRSITWSSWATTQYKIIPALPAGAHKIVAAFINNDETDTTCDRNLRVDWMGINVADAKVTPPATSAPDVVVAPSKPVTPSAPTAPAADPKPASPAPATPTPATPAADEPDTDPVPELPGLELPPVTPVPTPLPELPLPTTPAVPVIPVRTTPAPVNPTPTTPAPVNPTPVTPAPTNGTPIEAESLALDPSGAGTSYADPTARGGKAQLMWAVGTTSFTTKSAISTITVRAYGDQCSGAPKLQLSVDNVPYMINEIYWSDWATTQFKLPTALPAGNHTVKLAYPNDPEDDTSCDRNLRLDWVGVDVASSLLSPPAAPVTPAPPTPVTPTPVTPAPGTGSVSPTTAFYRNPNSQAAIWAAQARKAGKFADATLIDKMALTPSSVWLGGYTGDDLLLDTTLAEAKATKTRVLYTVYGIPDRDVGQYASAGGGFTAAGYKAWIDKVTGKIGSQAAMIVLEPDAMGQPLNTAALQNERWELLTYAIKKFAALPDTKVYLDAANSAWGWKPVDMAARLKSAGVQYATGIAVNTSNFNWTKDELAYGRAILAALGSKQHMIIDTSRNGKGPIAPGTSTNAEDYWCNPVNRALGAKPTMDTGVADVDAYVWAKRPGETDGPCHGGPSTGWFYEDALTLARNAAW